MIRNLLLSTAATAALLFLGAQSISTAHANCVLPYTFQDYMPGGQLQPIFAGQLNANFAAVVGCATGNGGTVTGPAVTQPGHVPIWSSTTGTVLDDPAGSVASFLSNRSGNYSSSANYGGTANSSGITEVLGSSGGPDSTQDAVGIFQKWSNSTTNYNNGINPTIYVTNIMTNGSSSSRGVAGYFEGQTNATGSSGNFIEGVRAHGTIADGVAGGAAYGVVSAAGEGTGASHFLLIGHESEVDNNSVDATYSFGTGNSTINHFEANFIATSRGSKLPFAAFMVNPFTLVNSAFQVGFFVPAASPNVPNAPVVGAAFRSDAPSVWGLDLTGHGAGPTFGAVGIPNNVPIRANNASGSAALNILFLDSNSVLFLGIDASQISIGGPTVPTILPDYVDFLSVAAPGAPAAGHFRVFMSAADNKLHAKGPSGTDTILANP